MLKPSVGENGRRGDDRDKNREHVMSVVTKADSDTARSRQRGQWWAVSGLLVRTGARILSMHFFFFAEGNYACLRRCPTGQMAGRRQTAIMCVRVGGGMLQLCCACSTDRIVQYGHAANIQSGVFGDRQRTRTNSARARSKNVCYAIH